MPILILVFCLSGRSRLQAPGSRRPLSSPPSKPDWIAPHIRFLASDLLEGRETTKRGLQHRGRLCRRRSSRPSASSRRSPEGFVLRMPMRHSTVDGTPTLMLEANGARRELVYGTDFLVQPDLGPRERGVRRGTGLRGVRRQPACPGLRRLRGDRRARARSWCSCRAGPRRFRSDERGHTRPSSPPRKRTARAHGAVGVVTLLPAPAAQHPGAGLPAAGRLFLAGAGRRPPHASSSRTPPRRGSPGPGPPRSSSWPDAPLPTCSTKLQQGTPQSFDLPVRHGLLLAVHPGGHRELEHGRVVRGSDPALRDEYVVYSAHMDHVGMGAPVNGDSVHHGALDNAGGTATLIAMARAFASLPTPPRRSVLFVAVSGEEKGILGLRLVRAPRAGARRPHRGGRQHGQLPHAGGGEGPGRVRRVVFDARRRGDGSRWASSAWR